ncbi:MAG: hypothetical protein IGR90_06210 [Synechococcales cyanobacterium K32_A2020_035]|nr:hypothetical protein [Synechococcales cyanobacterium K32_A2020_035]
MNRKLIPILIIGGGIAITALGIPTVLNSTQDHQTRLNRATGQQQGLAQSEMDNEVLANAKEIALARVESGCLVIVDLEENTFVAITEGARMVDPVSRNPLPPNIPVCDWVGGTAITTEGGVLINYAFLGDPDLIAAHVEKSNGRRAFVGAAVPPVDEVQQIGGIN